MPEIGLETARRARTEGADVVLTGRNADRLEQAALEVGARSTAAFDVNDAPALKRFFDEMQDRSTTCWSRARLRPMGRSWR